MRISKGFYIGSYIAGMALTIILIVVGLSRRRLEEGMPFILASYIPMIFAAVVYWVLYYKGWKAIQDGYARTTPGKAIGFLFIPFFNFYWVFQVTWGFAKDYNAFLDRHSINAQKLQR
jgi:multisubunit Na+/H+ antiporter MnhB subunit